jgi:hypothetical protein
MVEKSLKLLKNVKWLTLGNMILHDAVQNILVG